MDNKAQALIKTHETERALFLRMREMGRIVEHIKKIIALWLWLESHGLNGLIKAIFSHHDEKILDLVGHEAQIALESLEPGTKDASPSTIRLPVTLRLAKNESFPLEDKVFDKEMVWNGIFDILNGVCNMVFEDILGERKGKAKEGDGVGLEEIIEKWVKSRGGGDGNGQEELKCSSGFKLNPFAKEWTPAKEEERSLYITFSNGFPLTEQQIFNFFSRRYGSWSLEKVYVHQTGNKPPQFGRIVMRTSYFQALVLHGQEQVRFRIHGRSLWCKKFRPKKKDIVCSN